MFNGQLALNAEKETYAKRKQHYKKLPKFNLHPPFNLYMFIERKGASP